MQKIIQIYPCLLKLSRKQESVTDGQTDGQTDGLYYYFPSPLSRGIITQHKVKLSLSKHQKRKTDGKYNKNCIIYLTIVLNDIPCD
jgi:hypothetical protein